MAIPTDIIRSFYERLKVGDAAGALGLMATDIEWTTMWHYKVVGRGPERVAEGLFKPLVAVDWNRFYCWGSQSHGIIIRRVPTVGNQRRNPASKSPLKTAQRTCNRRCAPRLVQHMC